MTYELSYRDLQWEALCLRPVRYTEHNGEKTVLGSGKGPGEMISVDYVRRRAEVGMPSGKGKITDAGYDQAVCLTGALPAYERVIFRGTIRVLRYPSSEERNGQEGLGLFIRDTLEPDPGSGYPYANMAAAGFYHGDFEIFGRDGIARDDIENIIPIRCTGGSQDVSCYEGKELRIALEKNGAYLSAVVCDGEETIGELETDVREGIFASRDPKTMYLGFLAARGCGMEIDLDSVSIEYEDDSSSAVPALIVAPDGTADGQGTAVSPLDLQSALERCLKGQEIRALPGRYPITEDLIIGPENCGSVRSPKRITAERKTAQRVILDFGGSDHGFRIGGRYWEISGLTVIRGTGFTVSGSFNRIHHCHAMLNLETGFLIRHPSGEERRSEWPSGNTVSDCVSCMNMDRSQQNADGFACKVAAGPGNSFVRCAAWMNSDDGFDLFTKNRVIGAVKLTGCRSWLNGFTLQDGRLVRTRGNGNGFKLGGSGLAVDHEVFRCEAEGNSGIGFTSNSNPHMRLKDCDARNNSGGNYFFYYTGDSAQAVNISENCTQGSDATFDPSVWALEHLSHDGSDPALPVWNTSSDPEDVIIRELRHSSMEGSFGRSLEDAVREVRALAAKRTGKPGMLIMCSSLYGGGAERVACRLACGMSDKYDVTMLYIQDKGRTYYLEPCIGTVAMPYFEGSFDMIMDGRALFTRWLKETLDVSVSVSLMFTMNKINTRSAGKETVICSERNNPAKRDPEHMPEINGIYEAADHVVFQSEAVRSLFSDKVQSHSSVILNPVSVPCARTGGRHRIVTMGRLTPQKNQEMLIRAFAAFYREHPGYTLSIYGTGELGEKLQQLAGSLGVEDAVRFHGQVWDVHTAVADAEIFALSSNYEGLSNALLECMMMGFPCVSTRCEGSVDVIQSGKNGILTDVGSEKQMTAALSLLADDARLREKLGAEAAKTSEQYRTERILGQWRQLIGRLSAER